MLFCGGHAEGVGRQRPADVILVVSAAITTAAAPLAVVAAVTFRISTAAITIIVVIDITAV